MRINLQVPFERKFTARELGAHWDPARKVWFCPDGTDLQPFILAGFVPGLEKLSKAVRKTLKHKPGARKGRPR